jgi:NADH:ubiquinone reductase (H+-translocating)
MAEKHHIAIIGGGFGGLYAALELDKTIAKDPAFRVTLINRENFFLFTPMLHEVAASDLDLTNIVNPARKLLKHVAFFEGEVRHLDLEKRTITVAHGSNHHTHDLEFDQLVLALGCTNHFFALPGVEQHALTMKSLADAVRLRNRLIAMLEEADTECGTDIRVPLLTFVVAGAGFAGVETLGSINDFLRSSMRFYPNLREKDLRLVLVHPGEVILPELEHKLGAYAQNKLAKRGIEIHKGTLVSSYDGEVVKLSDGGRIDARTLIWTAGTMPHVLLESLPCAKEKGRLKVNDTLAVPARPGVWALGDCALVPDSTTGKYCPPTAQHALRQGRIVAQNIVAHAKGQPLKSFRFKTIGQLATIGHRAGVANIFGFNFSGFIAWWMWRTIYLSKLPRLEKKVRVALDWTLDVLFSKDLVQLTNLRLEEDLSTMDERDKPVLAGMSQELAQMAGK